MELLVLADVSPSKVVGFPACHLAIQLSVRLAQLAKARRQLLQL